MDFTGERFVPDGAVDGELECEHLLRYHAVAPLAAGKVVLDAASGEGYGAALLAAQAKEVRGLEIDGQAVRQARAKYGGASNLAFVQGSVARLPFGARTFDLVVSFETIEHVGAEVQEAFVREIKRVLRPGGCLVMSTPDREIYSDLPGYRNDFHVKEFSSDEFRDFLTRHFVTVRLWQQGAVLAHVLSTGEEACLRQFSTSGPPLRGKYLVALCGDGPLPETNLGAVVLDRQDAYGRKVRRILDLQVENAEKNWHIDHLLGDVRRYDMALAELGFASKAHAEQNAALHARLAAMEEELASCRRQADEEGRAAQAALVAVQAELGHIRATRGWRLVQAAYRLKDRLLGK